MLTKSNMVRISNFPCRQAGSAPEKKKAISVAIIFEKGKFYTSTLLHLKGKWCSLSQIGVLLGKLPKAGSSTTSSLSLKRLPPKPLSKLHLPNPKP